MKNCIAVMNAGSSSIKFALYEAALSQSPIYRGQIEQIGVAPHLAIVNAKGDHVAEKSFPPAGFDHRAATQEILRTAVALLAGAPVAGVGHRVVHGGMDYAAPMRIDAKVMEALAALTP